MFVSFSDDTESAECEKILLKLENIDDECSEFGVDLVKIHDPEAFELYNVTSVPAIAFFRKQVPMFFEG